MRGFLFLSLSSVLVKA